MSSLAPSVICRYVVRAIGQGVKLVWASLLASILAATGGGAAAPPGIDPAPAPDLPAITEDPQALEFTLAGGVWLPRLRGKSGLGPSSTRDQIDLDTELDLASTELAVSAELSIRKGSIWDVLLSGFDFSTGSRTTLPRDRVFGDLTLDSGDLVKSSVDMTSVAVEVGFASFRPLAGLPANRTDQEPPNLITDLRLIPEAGIRYVDVKQSLSSGAEKQDAAGEWLGVLAGLSLELRVRPQEKVPLFRMLEIDAGAAFGTALGGDGGTMWQVRAGLTWHFSECASILFGYRLLHLDVENEDFQFDAGLQGLYLAGVVTF